MYYNFYYVVMNFIFMFYRFSCFPLCLFQLPLNWFIVSKEISPCRTRIFTDVHPWSQNFRGWTSVKILVQRGSQKRLVSGHIGTSALGQQEVLAPVDLQHKDMSAPYKEHFDILINLLFTYVVLLILSLDTFSN